jgi:hypothetical protein
MKKYAEVEGCSVNDVFDIYVQIKIRMKNGADKKAIGQRIEATFKEIQDKGIKFSAEW